MSGEERLSVSLPLLVENVCSLTPGNASLLFPFCHMLAFPLFHKEDTLPSCSKTYPCEPSQYTQLGGERRETV